LTAIVEEVGRVVDDNIVARSRWRKHPNEIEGARRAHIADATAVINFMAWLARTVPRERVSELDAARKLEALRRENAAYKGPSMPLMSASGPNGSLPHYVPSSRTDRLLNDHPIYWMDSGGQYLGGTTDNTITLAVKEPEPKHIAAHTAVLKGYIALATATVPVGIYGFALEVFARQPLWREGMDYATGTGHGVGNYMNIHEGPYLSREPSPLTTAPIEADMILTNEPGYYAVDDFGFRIESHMVSVAARFAGFLQFETLSRFPIDPQLVDFSRLTPTESRWLTDYHRAVWRDVSPLLDGPAFAWLRELVAKYE
jgi:Xaa-Pro aminopeptidase